MARYRKKPVVVEAIRLMEPNTPDDLLKFCPAACICGEGAVGEKVWVEIQTLEGTVRGNYGDWIIKGVVGEFYPCRNDIFEATYEPVAPEKRGPAMTNESDVLRNIHCWWNGLELCGWLAVRVAPDGEVCDWIRKPSAEAAKAAVRNHWWAGHLARGETLNAYIVADGEAVWRYAGGALRLRWVHVAPEKEDQP